MCLSRCPQRYLLTKLLAFDPNQGVLLNSEVISPSVSSKIVLSFEFLTYFGAIVGQRKSVSEPHFPNPALD